MTTRLGEFSFPGTAIRRGNMDINYFAKSWKTTHQRQDLKETWNMNGRGSGDKMGKEGFRQREWHECANVRHA